ncbi:MAG TPA: YbaY family lipoprotein [Candidatus Sulfotelmatobacter sp.]|nr:YbaY family lipoprotein [Candidatus Sulfotelmatobacter sp.]
MPTKWSAMVGLAAGCLLGGAIMGHEPPTAPAALAPAPAQAAHNNVRRAIEWKRFEYTCEGGAKVTVSQSGTIAKVQYQGHEYLMKQTQSADGNRYSDGKVVWWGKGNGGFLQEDTPNWDGTMIVKDCKLDKPMNAETAVVTGTVSYLQRIALPPEAAIEMQLLELPQADAREVAKVVAEEKITLGNRQVPVAFEVKFDPAKIDAKRAYALMARILVGKEVRFTSDPGYPVLTAGNPSHVEMILKQVASVKTP